MTKKIQHIFALSEKGAKDLVKAVIWCFVCNLALMFPVGGGPVHGPASSELSGGRQQPHGTGSGSMWASPWRCLVLLFVLHWFQYASLYIATYRESANRRVSLAETLRRLPLSFFGNRDLSDLTSTMIADCSSLDQMFSPLCPPVVRLHRLHADNRSVYVPLRLAHGPSGAVGGARGGGADSGK